VTSSSTRPFDSPYDIFYWWSIAAEHVSLAVFEIVRSKRIGVTTLTFQGHVTYQLRDHSTRDGSFPIGGPVIGSKSLSLTVSEIFRPKHHVLINTMLNRHCAFAISRDVYPLCKF